MFPRLPGQQRLLHQLRLPSPLCVKSLGNSSPFATGKDIELFKKNAF
jgi:hypothetical protein